MRVGLNSGTCKQGIGPGQSLGLSYVYESEPVATLAKNRNLARVAQVVVHDGEHRGHTLPGHTAHQRGVHDMYAAEGQAVRPVARFSPALAVGDVFPSTQAHASVEKQMSGRVAAAHQQGRRAAQANVRLHQKSKGSVAENVDIVDEERLVVLAQ